MEEIIWSLHVQNFLPHTVDMELVTNYVLLCITNWNKYFSFQIYIGLKRESCTHPNKIFVRWIFYHNCEYNTNTVSGNHDEPPSKPQCPRWTSHMQHLSGTLWWQHPPSQVSDLPPYLLLSLSYPAFQKGSQTNNHPMPQLQVWHTTSQTWSTWTTNQLLCFKFSRVLEKNWNKKSWWKVPGLSSQQSTNLLLLHDMWHVCLSGVHHRGPYSHEWTFCCQDHKSRNPLSSGAEYQPQVTHHEQEESSAHRNWDGFTYCCKGDCLKGYGSIYKACPWTTWAT